MFDRLWKFCKWAKSFFVEPEPITKPPLTENIISLPENIASSPLFGDIYDSIRRQFQERGIDPYTVSCDDERLNAMAETVSCQMKERMDRGEISLSDVNQLSSALAGFIVKARVNNIFKLLDNPS